MSSNTPPTNTPKAVTLGEERAARAAGRNSGLGRIIIAVYGVFALSSTARAGFQILTEFGEAPLAYTLSAFAAVVYIVATLALASKKPHSWAVSLAAVLIELVGVLVVGTLGLLIPEHFAHPAVWTQFGSGYGYVPLLLPLVGLWWLYRHRP
ncbi:membrane protein [Arthrobacter ginkgonis]|uniref:Membrane protein n=1 Tax=Arthrobacter ginkgonis TaxID=1630594 RepID=A0ABP7CTR9_9MICC